MLALISEEAGALATADGNQELKLKCHLRYCSSGLFIIPMNNLQKSILKCNVGLICHKYLFVSDSSLQNSDSSLQSD
ncbi:hypothetical protein F2Q70_00029164 [Brassica cretica]|uniref:Uncharacterized protein n=2 Tax=Brassica cretica TaxID=69181 RepID=A0A3N6QCX0_BRACR|nr:hypothetical protein F2Q70_00029164 [Brassica cretica]KAF3500123.1 hypothetical protein F2Q69_00043639 [Brassica cretica]KAF3597374.1 hypothetical protein DY000_02020371 [Brassica cretica]